VDAYCARSGATRVPPGFSYNSGSNPEFLTVKRIRDLIRDHVKSDFQA
jgi:UDP-N-acetylglucosamine 4,6-dehydratase